MIEARGLGKRYGSAAAVDDLTFTIRPGMVTGFLGPNGAGKTEVCGLVAFGVGALVRNTAAALTIAYGGLALLPQLVKALPTPLVAGAVQFRHRDA